MLKFSGTQYYIFRKLNLCYVLYLEVWSVAIRCQVEDIFLVSFLNIAEVTTKQTGVQML